jgi:SSS family solute:Na+ symporter
MFWKKTTSSGALAAAIGSAVLSFVIKILWPELPFIDRVGIVFLLCILIAVVISVMQGNRDQEGSVELHDVAFATSSGFNLSASTVALILVALYATWW